MNTSAIAEWVRSHATLRVLGLLLLGQLVSLTMAIEGLTSSLVSDLGVYAPLTLSLSIYTALALVYGSILLHRRHKLLLCLSLSFIVPLTLEFSAFSKMKSSMKVIIEILMQVPWYWYLLLGFVDVQGNYLVNKAFQYSSITSVTLLDCWTVPWVIILTWFFIGTRYSLWQLVGAALCIVGLGLVFLSDAGVGSGDDGSRPLLGDTLVVAGTLFYALSNVSEEFCVKKKDRVEVVCMIGVFGFLVSIIEVSIIELKTLESVKWTAEIVLAFVGYGVSGFIFYTLAPFVLKLSGSTLFNLSLLTSDLWAVLFKIFFYHQEVDWLYFLSFAIVVVGLIIYSTTEKGSIPAPPTEDAQYQLLNNSETTNDSLAS